MKPRFIYIHGNGTTDWSSSAWAVWLKTKLDALGFETVFATMPDPELARSNYWLPYLQDILQVGTNDVLIGWSSGATAAMRYAETHKILGSLLVSPSYTGLGEESEKSSGYYDDPWNWNAIKSNQKHLAEVWGTDDPFIPQADFSYIALHLSADKIKIPGGKHFIDRQDMPEVLRYIQMTYTKYLL